jgi:hypothetical protein
VHVCLVLTSRHFGTRVLRNSAGLAAPAAVVMAGALGVHWLLGLLWGNI